MKPHALSATTLTGFHVHNLQNEKVGTIADFMIDLESGQVLYAVIARGGFLGLGDEYFAVPMESFTFNDRNDNVIELDTEKKTLDNAPGFSNDSWPSGSSTNFTNSVYSHYGYERPAAYGSTKSGKI